MIILVCSILVPRTLSSAVAGAVHVKLSSTVKGLLGEVLEN
jgi:hypothetical protein